MGGDKVRDEVEGRGEWGCKEGGTKTQIIVIQRVHGFFIA